MVKNRHTADRGIPEISFSAPAGTPAGVEVMTLAQLRARGGRPISGRPQRPTFHHLLTVSRGTLWHTVDFTRYALTPGRWLWVRPAQVQQWGQLDAVDGALVLFQPDFLVPDNGAARLDDPHAPILYEPAGDDGHRLSDATEHLTRAFTSPGELPLEVHQAVLRHLLAVLVLCLVLFDGPSGSPALVLGVLFLCFC